MLLENVMALLSCNKNTRALMAYVVEDCVAQ